MPVPFDRALWERGFRPFFLLAAGYAVLAIPLWALQFGGVLSPGAVFDDPVLWHGHETLFGFTAAVIAGFLLTAVANWTGGNPAKGAGLALLTSLWLAGRIAVNVSGVPYALAAALDILFLPALAFALSIPLFKSRNRHNFIFLFMLGALFLCNLHLWVYQDKTALHVALVAAMGIVSAIGGRIIPSFTVAGLRRQGINIRQTDQRLTDLLAIMLLLGLALCVVFTSADSMASGLMALAAAGVHLWRHRLYHPFLVWRDPMLWSLHAGHLWLIAGLAFWGASAFDVVPFSSALHALTVGTIGTLTLSMMCRVALGHTGREIRAGYGTAAAFVSMQGAAWIRVFGPVLFPAMHMQWIGWSAALWALAFAIYIAAYASVLCRPGVSRD